jgi:hypothetical protein
MTQAGLAGRRKTLDAFYNAMRIFYRKHYDDKYPKLLTWLVLSGISLKHKLAILKLKFEYQRSKDATATANLAAQK